MFLRKWDIEDIPDEALLYRRIFPLHYDKYTDKISSAAYRGKYDCRASVDWEKYTTPERSIKKYPQHHLATLKAEIPRKKYQKVEHVPSLSNRSHSEIIGKKTYSVAKFLADNSTLIIKR